MGETVALVFLRVHNSAIAHHPFPRETPKLLDTACPKIRRALGTAQPIIWYCDSQYKQRYFYRKWHDAESATLGARSGLRMRSFFAILGSRKYHAWHSFVSSEIETEGYP